MPDFWLKLTLKAGLEPKKSYLIFDHYKEDKVRKHSRIYFGSQSSQQLALTQDPPAFFLDCFVLKLCPFANTGGTPLM